jgi:hypothetical protein
MEGRGVELDRVLFVEYLVSLRTFVELASIKWSPLVRRQYWEGFPRYEGTPGKERGFVQHLASETSICRVSNLETRQRWCVVVNVFTESSMLSAILGKAFAEYFPPFLPVLGKEINFFVRP